ncbi:MAG: hypothetical protein CMJ86_04925 [Planctomycetes bacterium]|nr:hypothetical protein [Planctomycetota bacterium]
MGAMNTLHNLALRLLSALLALALSGGLSLAQDPEATPKGREQFLGRTIARTMHSSGANWLVRERREQEESASTLRRWLNIQPGQSVCDFGCGNGYHTLPMAEAVGSTGQVFAVDLQAEMLRLLGLRLAEAGIDNTISIQGTLDDPRLPAGELDMILMVDVYHELSHPVRVMRHLREALKPDGRMVLVEFRGEDAEVPIKALHRMDRAQVVREMAAHGMRFVESFEELPWQHALVFERALEVGVRHQPREVARGFLRALARRDEMGLLPFLNDVIHLDTLPVSRELFLSGTGLSKGALPDLPGPLLELRAGPEGTVLAGPMPRPAFFSILSLFADSAVPVPTPGLPGELVLRADSMGAWAVEGWRTLQPDDSLESARHMERPFFAMNTGTGSGTPKEQAALACEMGFDGIGWGIWRAPEVRMVCEQKGADLWSIYCVLRLDEGDSPRMRQLLKAMSSLAGGPGMIWLALEHPKAEHDTFDVEHAVQTLLTPVLQLAQDTGVEVALYPHHGFWISTTEDALVLCERFKHPRLGVCFNLSHFLAGHETSDPGPLLQSALPYLLSVTVNGADSDGEAWDSLIQPLGRGDFDLDGLLGILDRLGWVGPVGLQAFGIKLPAREHLALSLAAWEATQKE